MRLLVLVSRSEWFAESHNGTLCECLSNILQIDLNQCDEVVRDVATLLLSMGGLGLWSAVRVRSPAYWASWADCLPMMQARHLRVVAKILAELGDRSASPCLEEAGRAAWDLMGVMGFEPPSWHAVVNGARTPPDGEQEPGSFERVWQHEALSRVERQHREVNQFPRLSKGRALVRSQAGPGSGLALSTCRRGYAVESVAARICWEAGERFATNVFVRDVHNARDARRLEVVADGLPLFGGAQLTVAA